MTYPTKYCPRHACKMTLLFTSYVCDICDPPKGGIIDPVISCADDAMKNIDWAQEFFLAGKQYYINSTSNEDDVRDSSLLIAMNVPLKKQSSDRNEIFIIKHPRPETLLSFNSSISLPWMFLVDDNIAKNLAFLATHAGSAGVIIPKTTAYPAAVCYYYVAILEVL